MKIFYRPTDRPTDICRYRSSLPELKNYTNLVGGKAKFSLKFDKNKSLMAILSLIISRDHLKIFSKTAKNVIGICFPKRKLLVKNGYSVVLKIACKVKVLVKILLVEKFRWYKSFAAEK